MEISYPSMHVNRSIKTKTRNEQANQTVMNPTPNFSAIGESPADYELTENFNQSLTNSILNP